MMGSQGVASKSRNNLFFKHCSNQFWVKFLAVLVFSFRKHDKHVMSSVVYYHMLLKCRQTC